MKKLLFYFIFLSPFCLLAQTKKTNTRTRFVGEWANKSRMPQTFNIGEKGSDLSLGYYQLFAYCKNVYKNDTLFLCDTATDGGNEIVLKEMFKYKESYFAKCFIKNEVLHVIYSHKMSRFPNHTKLYRVFNKSEMSTANPNSKS